MSKSLTVDLKANKNLGCDKTTTSLTFQDDELFSTSLAKTPWHLSCFK